MKALVLAGGGSKGAYQIGAWKALRKLKFKFDIVTGTSIGALNGALVAQDNYFRAKRLWLTTDFYKLLGSDLKDVGDTKKAFKLYSKNLFNQTGLDTDKLQWFINKYVNFDKLYNSNINYGLVTYNLSTMSPHFVTKNSVTKEKISDYIVASASFFPAFEMKEIDGDKFIDGGYYDNLPINLAIDMGADEVIAIELDSIGIRQPVKNKNVKVTYIRPSCELGNFLVFDKKNIKKNMCMGYNDTMKFFKELDGNFYTFKKGDLKKNFDKHRKDFSYTAKRMIGINNKRIINKLMTVTFYKSFIENNFDDFDTFNKSIELLGEIFEIPSYKIYDINLFNHMIRMKFENYDDNDFINFKHLKKLNFEKIINRKKVIKSIYKYMLKPIEYHKELADLCILFPNEFMGALYLYTIN